MPGMAVQYKLHGYRGLKAKLRKERLAGPLRHYWHNCGQLLVERARANTEPNIWRSEVYDSIHYVVDGSSPPMWMNAEADSEHAIFLEMGTSPGYFPNVDNLSEYTDEPFLMGAAIEASGTKPYPFMGPAAEQAIPGLVAYVGLLALEIEMAFSI